MLAPAKTMDDMHQVVLNSTVDGVLAVIFAVLIIVVVADASRVWVRAIRAREPLATAEAPHVRSRIVAPSGLWPNAAERALARAAAPGAAGGGRHVTPVRAALRRACLRYLREVAGENAYDRYLEHRRREHPGEPLLDRRAFERRRAERAREEPTGALLR